jgi:hypothetical protein
VLREDDGVAFDPFQQQRRQDDGVPRDGRQGVESDQRLRPHPQLAGRERDDLAAVDVEPPHPLPERREERLTVLRPGRHRLHLDLRVRPVPRGGADHRDDERGIAVADEVEPELHAGEDAVAGEVEVDVVDRSLRQAHLRGRTRAEYV